MNRTKETPLSICERNFVLEALKDGKVRLCSAPVIMNADYSITCKACVVCCMWTAHKQVVFLALFPGLSTSTL